jgi:hypothetical protein
MNIPTVTAPEIKHLPPRFIIGKRMEMSLAADQTALLWQRFMPQKKNIPSAGKLHLPGRLFRPLRSGSSFSKMGGGRSRSHHCTARRPGALSDSGWLIRRFCVPRVAAGFFCDRPVHLYAMAAPVGLCFGPASAFFCDGPPVQTKRSRFGRRILDSCKEMSQAGMLSVSRRTAFPKILFLTFIQNDKPWKN